MKDSGFGSFFAGVVIGGLVGAALGLILAPQTGDELREHVNDFVEGKSAEIGDAVNEGRPPRSRRAPTWSTSTTPMPTRHPRAPPPDQRPTTDQLTRTRAGGSPALVVERG